MNAQDIVATVSSGRTSAVEIVRAALDRIAAAKALNAVVTVDAERSLSDAAKIDRRLQLGETMPLAGVPIVIKDNIWVDGWRVTQGSRLFADFVAPCDAIAVERLKKAGAVVVGMGATSEFACKGVTTSLAVRANTTSAQSGIDTRWFVGRPGNGCRGRPRTAGNRHRRRWLEPAPSGPCRCCRLQAILWRHSIWPGVRRAVFRHIRDRANRPQRRRRGARIRGDGRSRCPGF